MGGKGRIVAILARKYAAEWLRNPTMLAAVAIPALCALVYRFVWIDNNADATAYLNMFAVSYAFMFEGIMFASTLVMQAVGEESEKGALGVLLRAGVTRRQAVAARTFALCALFFAVGMVCCATLGFEPWPIVALTTIGLLCEMPLMLASAAVSFSLRTQTHAALASIPVLLMGLLPFLAYSTSTFDGIAPYLPGGGMTALASVVLGIEVDAATVATSLAMTAAWLVATAVFFAIALHRARLRTR